VRVVTGRPKVTLNTLREMKARQEPITWLTAYDYPTARVMDQVGIDMILVGDSLGMTVLGHESTLPVTMDQMVTFTAAVSRAVGSTFVVGDMPFLSYQADVADAIRNAGRLMAEGGADAVKLEGGARMAPAVEAITAAGIPVIGHIGLTPQSASQLGGYRAQGRTEEAAKRLADDAEALERAGAVALLVECVPPETTALIVDRVDMLVLGLGSGPACDGQLLIVHDMLGLFDRFTPKFVKRYAELGAAMREAFAEYQGDVKHGRFPGPEHAYSMSAPPSP
jgi:3-methyl-2-oxobutanoate hydroxymethyltransferase